MTVSVDNLEREREFYYNKLRDIELLCESEQIEDGIALIEKIKEILYATEDGFFQPADGAELEDQAENEKNGDYQEEY